jgi:hypothetical protein
MNTTSWIGRGRRTGTTWQAIGGSAAVRREIREAHRQPLFAIARLTIVSITGKAGRLGRAVFGLQTVADLDVKGRKIWRHLVPHSSQPWGFRLGWFNIDTHESGQFSEGGWDGTYPTISFMPDNRLLHVIRGQPGGAANIRRFSVDNMAWAMESLKGPMGRAGPSCYFRGAIYCTTDQSHFFAVQPDGTLKVRASTPIIMDRAIENTVTYSILCPVGEHIYAFCGNGDIWRYDPNADRWGDRPYDAIPWLWPHDTLSATGWHYLKQACVGPVSSLGVAMLCSARRVTRQGVSPSRALIWKP